MKALVRSTVRRMAMDLQMVERMWRIASLLIACLMGSALLGCHESDIEPESPVNDDWMVSQWQQPAITMSQRDFPPVLADNPAPLSRVPTRSISLGFMGDSPIGGGVKGDANGQYRSPLMNWPQPLPRFASDEGPYADMGPRGPIAATAVLP